MGLPDFRIDLTDPIYTQGPIEQPPDLASFVESLIAEVGDMVRGGALDEWSAAAFDKRCEAYREQWDAYSAQLHEERRGLASARVLAIKQRIRQIDADLDDARSKLKQQTQEGRDGTGTDM